MMVFRKTFQIFLGIIFIIIAGFIVFYTSSLGHAQSFSEGERNAAEQIDYAEIDGRRIESLRRRLAGEERIRLVANLKLGYRDEEGNLRPQSEIESVKAQVISDLRGDGIESLRAIANAPAIGVVVTSPEGLDFLLQHPQIENVWEDTLSEMTVTETRKIIHATAPWNGPGSGQPYYDGAGVAVAILDTGVDPNAGMTIQAEACFSTANPAAYIDTLCPGPGFQSTPSGTLTETGSAVPCKAGCDHGTNVAGIAVGDNSTVNREGVAPGASVVAIQVFSNQEGKILAQGSDIKAGLAQVLYYNNNRSSGANKIVAVNMSLGSAASSQCSDPTGFISPEIYELKQQGVTVIASSGNDSSPAKIVATGWPACIDLPSQLGKPAAGVISVGATNDWDVVAAFSNSGKTGTVAHLDLLAPGRGIEAVIDATTERTMTGTSQAAPHVAGCVALLAQQQVAAPAGTTSLTDIASVNAFETAMKATGLLIHDWRDYSTSTPRLDCGAALWNMRGKNHLATISGTKTDANGNPLEGWLVEAYSVVENWGLPPYAGHPSYSALTNAVGEYEIRVPWGQYALGESPYGPIAGPNATNPSTTHWQQVSSPTGSVLVDPNSMGPFPGRDFVNREETFCPAGQDYQVFVANNKDHYDMPLDSASPSQALNAFFFDRYNPDAPAPMELDEISHSTRAFIHTFDFDSHIPSDAVITKARFDIGARPVLQPPTQDDGTYILPKFRLERNDAVWLIFPDANGGILGNPTVWGRGIGAGSKIGTGIYLSDDWDYPRFEIRQDFQFELAPLPMPGAMPQNLSYIDADLRPMINQQRNISLMWEDDTGIDYAAAHLCTKRPTIEITKIPDKSQFDLNDSTSIDLTITNSGLVPISASNQLRVTDEIPSGFRFDPSIISGTTYTSWGQNWSCKPTFGATVAGGSHFECLYTALPFAAGGQTMISVPVVAAKAGTHQNCVSVDVMNKNDDVVDHNSDCTVNSIGYDIGVRKRKSENMIKWDDPDTPLIDEQATFTLQTFNYGQEFDIPPGGVAIVDQYTHKGFADIAGSLNLGTGWGNCGGTTPPTLACIYQPSSIQPGFQPAPLNQHGYQLLDEISFDVKGTEIGFFENCLKALLIGQSDTNIKNDKWCVNIFVQGNIFVQKTTSRILDNHEFDFDLIAGKSEPIDMVIDIENWAGAIGTFTNNNTETGVVVVDDLNPNFELSNTIFPSGPWDCAPPGGGSFSGSPGEIIECEYRKYKIDPPIPAGSPPSTTPTVPFELDLLTIPVISNEPGIFQNCAGGDISILPGPQARPLDDTPDAITPPDPPYPVDTDFQRMDHNGDCVRIIVGHDVRLFKSATPSTVLPGETLQFEFTVSNHWSALVPGEQLILGDILPQGFTLDGPLPTGGVNQWNCSAVSGVTAFDCVFEVSGSNLTAGVLPALVINARASEYVGNYENCADLVVRLLNGDQDDVPENNERRCVDLHVAGQLNVKKKLANNSSSFDVGDLIVFEISIENIDGIIADTVQLNLSDVVTPGYGGVSGGVVITQIDWPSGWGCNNSSTSCTYDPSSLGPIDPGDSFGVSVIAEALAHGIYENCFNADLFQPDDNGVLQQVPNAPGSGHDPCVTFYVGHDVAIAKSVDNPTPNLGDIVTFTLPISNNLGEIAAPPTEVIRVTDIMDPGLTPNMTFITDPNNNPNWECSVVGQTITCDYLGAAPADMVLDPIILQAQVGEQGVLENCASVSFIDVTDDILTNNGDVCASVTVLESYMSIDKVFIDRTGGTVLPSVYTTTGFPIRLSCSSLPGIPINVPIKGGFFSTNDPALISADPNRSMTVTPSTGPSTPGVICRVTEAALPPIQSQACNGSASWTTSFMPANGMVAIPSSGTASVTVTNTLECDSYMSIDKVFIDRTGGTMLPSVYTTTGFPIKLECSTLPGAKFSVPIKGGFFSTNDPAQINADPNGSMTVTPSTGPSTPGVVCTVTEDPLPLIQNVNACNGRDALWTTTYASTDQTTNNSADGTVTIPSSGTAKVTVTNTLECEKSYLFIDKVFIDQTGGGPAQGSTMLPSVYTTTGFPIKLECSSLPGVKFAVPIKDGFFSTNNPALISADPNGSMTVTPSTGPSTPGVVCTVTEDPLPPIQNVNACNGGDALWTTTYASIDQTTNNSADGTVTIPSSGTAKVTVTNTLECEKSYMSIDKVFIDQTGGGPAQGSTLLPSEYTTTGFPIRIECSTLPGTKFLVRIKGGFFSTNNPALISADPNGSMTVTPSTGPSTPGVVCMVTEDPLPPIKSLACGDLAYWTTIITPASGTVTIPSSGTASVTVTNSLGCTRPQYIAPPLD